MQWQKWEEQLFGSQLGVEEGGLWDLQDQADKDNEISQCYSISATCTKTFTFSTVCRQWCSEFSGINCLMKIVLALLELRFINYPCLISLCANAWWFSWRVIRAFSGEILPASEGVPGVVNFCHEATLICNISDRNCTCAPVTVWRKEKHP